MKSNSTLASLDLSSNSLGESGGLGLAEAPKSNSSLITLNLERNLLGKGAGMAFAEALKSNTTLTELSLVSNSLGERSGMALGQALPLLNRFSLYTIALEKGVAWREQNHSNRILL